MSVLSDVAAERAVLAGIFRYGAEAYYDVSDIVQTDSFTVDSNQVIYSCIEHAYKKDDAPTTIDIPVLYSSAKEIGLFDFVSKNSEAQHLRAVMDFPVLLTNIRRMAGKVRKLHIARQMDMQLENAQTQISQITGEETITNILGIAENAIFDFSSLLNNRDDDPILLTKTLKERADFLAANKCEQIGFSTGYHKYDFAIGGGLRRGTVNMIGARPKMGKSLLAVNIGLYVSSKLKVPVLGLDTEMMSGDTQDRMLGMISETSIKKIETGQFVDEPYTKDTIYKMIEEHENAPYYWKNIGGRPFEEQLSIMRRWVARTVGLNTDGLAKDCVIIYDYLKMMDDSGLKNLQEYQALGFMMTGLHNFAVKYGVPILGFVQLNRDGITKENTDAVAGSDRVIWLCSNFTIFKDKSSEEQAEDGPNSGNRKLVPLIARHGEGLENGEYINMQMKGSTGKIEERKTNLEIQTNMSEITFTDNEEDVPFD